MSRLGLSVSLSTRMAKSNQCMIIKRQFLTLCAMCNGKGNCNTVLTKNFTPQHATNYHLVCSMVHVYIVLIYYNPNTTFINTMGYESSFLWPLSKSCFSQHCSIYHDDTDMYPKCPDVARWTSDKTFGRQFEYWALSFLTLLPRAGWLSLASLHLRRKKKNPDHFMISFPKLSSQRSTTDARKVHPHLLRHSHPSRVFFPTFIMSVGPPPLCV